jgi:prepilin-type N-terminal cleavage/methylation domain-containing protein/prepilin-type processing-associated H-X9-DG protein
MSSISPRKARRAAFTLVELLVVIGIIALLISILLPSLSRAREQGNAVKCLSNLRQLGMAFVMYTNANKGALPADAPNNKDQPEDFVHWETGRNLEESALGPYWGKPFPASLLICPTDDVNNRERVKKGGYRFSYVMNGYVSSITGSGISAANSIKRINQAINAPDKLLAYEEDPYTIDDGHATPQPTSSINLLAIRHDRTRRPENPADPLGALSLNGEKRGNACFLDGHASYIDRNTLHSLYTHEPKRRFP